MPRLPTISIFAIAFVPGPVSACSVPVFRYALERWNASPYEVLLVQDGSCQNPEIRQRLESAGANLIVRDVDLAGQIEPRLKAWLDRHARSVDLPALMVRYPDSAIDTPPAWIVPLDDDHATLLLDSPVRQRIAGRLGRGETGVFLLLETGNAEADEKLARMLEDERVRLEKVTRVPEPTNDGPQPRTKLPLRVRFSVIRLSRTEPAEAAFISMLLHSEPGLANGAGPIVFALFGRGRLLTGLIGDDLNADELARVAQFLCGACSCQVKEFNPGTDMLFAADWETMMMNQPPEPEPVEANPPEPRKRSRWLWPAVGATLAVNIFALAWGLRSMLRSSSPR